MRLLIAIAIVASLCSPADAAELNGTWAVTALEDGHSRRDAEALMPEGCWSRELWVFGEHTLRRGHQRICGRGRGGMRCEAWVEVPATPASPLLLRYGAEATSQGRTAHRRSTEVDGTVHHESTSHGVECSVQIVAGLYTVERDGDAVVLQSGPSGLRWTLQPAEPALPTRVPR